MHGIDSVRGQAVNEDEVPRFCVHDHSEHVHMIFRCRCGQCENPVRDYRIDCTLDELCDVAPRDRMHIHESPPDTKPTDPAVLAASLIDRESNGDERFGTEHRRQL